VISDDLEMGAVAPLGTPGERALRTLEAGADLALFCHHLDAPRTARDEIVRAIDRGQLDGGAVRRSQVRLASLLGRFDGGRGPGGGAAAFGERVAELRELLEGTA
jgi:beta-N-acetylhexosaminidase